MISNATQRTIFRWIHIVLAIPIAGYVYSPFDEIPNYAPAVRFVFLPLMVLTGLLMWKGHLLRRLFKRAGQSRSCEVKPTFRRSGRWAIFSKTFDQRLDLTGVRYRRIRF